MGAEVSWGSFVLGLFCGAVLSGSFGIVIGSLLAQRPNYEQPSAGSELAELLQQAGATLPPGDVVSFTIGHDVGLEGSHESRCHLYEEDDAG